MSRIAKNPILVPREVDVKIFKQNISVSGKYGKLDRVINKIVLVQYIHNYLFVSLQTKNQEFWSVAGTERSLLKNMIFGVTYGFEKKLILTGVGYRAVVKNKKITLSLGYSHNIEYEIPDNIIAESHIPTEIVLKSCDKQLLGQVAADIRSYRRPDAYKGKGIRYETEILYTKEPKKK